MQRNSEGVGQKQDTKQHQRCTGQDPRRGIEEKWRSRDSGPASEGKQPTGGHYKRRAKENSDNHVDMRNGCDAYESYDPSLIVHQFGTLEHFRSNRDNQFIP